jgi:hypothetical protein
LTIEIITPLAKSKEFNLCEKIRAILANDPSTAHIAQLVDIKVCGAAAGNSIVLYLLCGTVDSVLLLRELYDNNELRMILEDWFRKLFDTNPNILDTPLEEGSRERIDSIKEPLIVAIYLVDYNKCLRYIGNIFS